MAQTPPFRSRPRLHLELAKLTGSPGYQSQSNQPNSSFSTPQNVTAYSPFRYAGLKLPTQNEGTVQLTPSRTRKPKYYTKCSRFRVKRLVFSKPLWLILMIGALLLWWYNGGRDELDLIKLGASGFRNEAFQEERTRNLQFFPASNPKIHYVGRWTATPNRLRKDGAFPGVYLDIIVKNTTTLLLSLHNAIRETPKSHIFSSTTFSTAPTPSMIHVPFRPMSTKDKPSPPVSLLARVDEEEYVLLPNASALVLVRNSDLNKSEEHRVRVIAPMADEYGQGVVELEGLWLSTGGKLSRVEGSLLSKEYENEDAFSAENEQVGKKHRAGLHDLLEDKDHVKDGQEIDNEEFQDFDNYTDPRRKVLEVVTDSPGFLVGKRRGSRTGGADGLLGGIMGWEYLLGEIFGADHISIGVDGMCLTQECIGGVGQPAGIGDVFFRSGPTGSAYFDHTWMFDAYVPDVIILNIGGSDAASFEEHSSEYIHSAGELSERFENTYISLIKAIRSQAYPQHPSIVHNHRSDQSAYVSDAASAFIPIFIMRPLRGQLEHSTHSVVSRLRADGDKAVFWLDTSGWLEEDESANLGDFFEDKTTTPSKWRLTEQGNQRVAIFLHSHVCRYLASEEEKCPFLPHEVYQGKVFDPEQANFVHHLENEKESKLKQLFWEDEASDDDMDALLE